MASELPTPDPVDVVLTFLESVGRRSEAELYLRLFRGVPKHSFAIIVTEASVLRHARASLVDAWTFLRDLGLFAPVIIGMSAPESAERAARRLEGSVHSLDATLHAADDTALAASLHDELGAGRLPIVHAGPLARTTAAERYHWLGDLVRDLESRKVVVLRRRGGIGPHGAGPLPLPGGHVLETHRGGIGIINATVEVTPLREAGLLHRDESELLHHLADLVRRPDVHAVASVTSPLAMLQELFTQKGAGTLVRKGSIIERHDDYSTVDRARLEALLEGTFAARLAPGFFERPVGSVFVEQGYRGAAIVEPGAGIAFLTKFAVEPVAQGEGMGRDLWRALVRHHPAVYWRARMDNAVGGWYADLADGTMRHESWRVFWRGVPPERVPTLVADAVARPIDFRREGA